MATPSSSTGFQTQNERGNAFAGIAEQGRCVESSIVRKEVPCDVFINHRGSDVKRTFARDIYNKLNRTGLKVFLDELWFEAGDEIPSVIQDAMNSASVHIAIFSENYAESPWCLAELSFMLKTGTKIIPIFYHVEPSVLRWVAQGKGIFADAFSKYKEKSRYLEELENWQKALGRVSYIDGYIVKNNGDEGVVLKSIINSVLDTMEKVPLEVAKHPVGLDEAVQDFEASLSDQNVKMVGIVGMGGSGKTTLAKEIYNRQFSSFANSSFVFDVKDNGDKKAMVNLQKKLLEDLLPRGFGNLPFHNINDGKRILANRLRSVRVLIVLDDVDDVDQLDVLLPAIDNLGAGSLIIITTREQNILVSRGISSIYQIKMLNTSHAKELFCWHAFLQRNSLDGFEDLVTRFVSACGGLPLSLKVLGGQLYCRSKKYWESQFNKNSRILPEDIKKRFKLSYDALDKEEKEIFMDVACFFIGEKKSLAIAVWDGCGWSGLYSCQRLVDKCMVELDRQNRIKMHDHLRDLGREIASRKSLYRLWSSEHLADFQKRVLMRGIMGLWSSGHLADFRKRVLIRGIMAATTHIVACSAHDEFPISSSHYQPPFEECMKLLENSNKGFKLLRRSLGLNQCMKLPENSNKGFKHLRRSLGLNLLVVRGDYFSPEFAKLSENLVWLRWFDFKDTNLPSWLSLKNLRVLELHGALRFK